MSQYRIQTWSNRSRDKGGQRNCEDESLTFPDIVEPKLLCPDTDHAPTIEQDNANGDGVEHGLCGQAEALLDLPEGKDTYSLSCYAHD